MQKTFTVAAGERYRIRAKGYLTGANPVYIRVKAGGVDLDWPGATLSASAATESWTEQIVTIPAGATTLQVGVAWYSVSNGEIFYLNELEVTQLTTPSADYQYFLKDHLGNIRVTFSTSLPTTNYTATFETGTQTAEQANFLNYSSITYDLVDHTDAANTVYQKVQYLNGGASGRVGLAKTFPVMAGDEITVTAYGKYRNLTGTSNTTSFITALATAFGVTSGSTGEQGRIYSGLNSFAGTVPAGDHTGDNEGAPKAFVTILFFDKNYNFVDAAWDQMTTTGLQTSGTVKEPPHDILSQTKKAPVAGYAYVFLSNEHPTFVDVYYDDVTVTNVPSPVIQTQDYYPFGLTFNSYVRENTTPQEYRYNGKELQDELGLGWLDYGARMYQPEIGRFTTIDPAGEKFYPLSAYSYSANSPILLSDPTGRDWTITTKENKNGGTTYVIGFKGAILDSSGEKFDEEQMAQFANQIKAGLTQFIGGTELVDEEGNSTSDNVEMGSIDVRVISSRDQLEKDDHLINIKDRKDKDFDAGNGQRAKGNAINGKEVSFNEAWFHDVRRGQYNSLISHELGHTAGLVHPEQDKRYLFFQGETGGAPASNFMRDSPTEPETGVTRAQVQRIYRLYRSGHLNKKNPHPVDQD